MQTMHAYLLGCVIIKTIALLGLSTTVLTKYQVYKFNF